MTAVHGTGVPGARAETPQTRGWSRPPAGGTVHPGSGLQGAPFPRRGNSGSGDGSSLHRPWRDSTGLKATGLRPACGFRKIIPSSAEVYTSWPGPSPVRGERFSPDKEALAWGRGKPGSGGPSGDSGGQIKYRTKSVLIDYLKF